MRLTFFGLSPQRCTAAECGDRTVEAPSTAPGQPATLSATVAYPKSGRYVVRVDVSWCCGGSGNAVCAGGMRGTLRHMQLNEDWCCHPADALHTNPHHRPCCLPTLPLHR